jgi:hypothetical protein
MLTVIRGLGLALLAIATTACEPTVMIERDDTTRIASGARWAWSAPDADGPNAAQGEITAPTDVQVIITEAIAQGLEARGFTRTSPDSAQFLVHFHLARRDIVDTIPTATPPQDWGRYGNPEQMRDRTVSWQEGLLVIDALTADGRTVAWRGIIYGEVRPEAERDPTSAIRSAVEQLLAKFP